MRSVLATLAIVSVVAVGGTVLPCGSTARAASFDCTKATTPDEIAICGNRALEDSDVEMSTIYTMVLQLVGMGQRGDLQTAQSAWLTKRAQCGSDVQCISAAYASQIAALQATFQTVVAQGPF